MQLFQAESSRGLNAGGMGRQDWETETFVLERTGGGFDAPIAFHNRQDPDVSGDVTHPIGRQDNGLGLGMKVRRLTPLECERLQGFPDGWTDVPYRGKPAADGPRYKALGNSMAVNCMRWIGERIRG